MAGRGARMIAVVLAALASVAYGSSDYTGALASKRMNAALVTVAVQSVSLVALIVVLVAAPEDHRSATDLAWAALAGLGGGVGLALFYDALARGPMSVAASMSGLTAASVPVLAGLALGDRPSALALAGIALSIPAVVMVSTPPASAQSALATLGPREQVAAAAHAARTRQLAVGAGLGFGLFFVALSRLSDEAGLFPLLGARTASIVLIAALVTHRRVWEVPPRSSWPLLVVTGGLDCAANVLYLKALDEGLFTWVAAVTSLYPVTTALLARWLLREHLGRNQIAGLVLAGGALVLVAIGR